MTTPFTNGSAGSSPCAPASGSSKGPGASITPTVGEEYIAAAMRIARDDRRWLEKALEAPSPSMGAAHLEAIREALRTVSA